VTRLIALYPQTWRDRYFTSTWPAVGHALVQPARRAFRSADGARLA
jgi:hypothetical protein